MKKPLTTFSMLVIIIGMLMIAGCSKSDNPVAAGPAPVTQIVANGSLAPTSRTQAQGTMLIADQSGNPITGLTAQNISGRLVWTLPTVSHSDSVVGTIVIQSLSQSGKNIAVATTMDYSGSMYDGIYDTAKSQYKQILDMETGVKTFVNALKTNDIAEIIKFDSYVYVVQPFTSSKPALLHAVDSVLDLGNSTALFASIVTGIKDVAAKSASSYARAVVAFTDGGENASAPITMDTLLRIARSNAIPVYTIGLFIDSTEHSTPPGQNSTDEENLVQIADSTGGFYFYAPKASQLQQIYNSISGQLSNAYTVSITWPSTTLPPSGTQVTAVITVNYNGLISIYRQTYSIP